MTDEPRKERCETCRFWDGPHLDRREASCLRNAPVALPVMLMPEGENVDHWQAFWPDTMPWEWCGEWQPKAVDAPP